MKQLINALEDKIDILKHILRLQQAIINNGDPDKVALYRLKQDQLIKTDLRFVSAFERFLGAHHVMSVSELPEGIQQDFKPVQALIQTIKDIEFLIDEEKTQVLDIVYNIEKSTREGDFKKVKINNYKKDMSK